MYMLNSSTCETETIISLCVEDQPDIHNKFQVGIAT